jgi:hypothetical protein
VGELGDERPLSADGESVDGRTRAFANGSYSAVQGEWLDLGNEIGKLKDPRPLSGCER